MISKKIKIEILRLYHAEKWRPSTIAHELGIHHTTVTRTLAQEGKTREISKRPRMIDPFLPLIMETLENYPRLSATRLYNMVKERGYPGKPSQFRAIIAELRPTPAREAYFRLKTLPAEQAQVDWGHFGRLTCGEAHRPLMAFVMVLSYSRAIFLHFFLSQHTSNFMRGHELAFNWFGGVSRVYLYDNLKSVVLERIGSAIHFNPQFLEFAGHYRFEPRPVAVARGNEKGRAERAIRYIRSNFFAGRRFKTIDELNAQALEWCATTALERRWQDDLSRTVGEVLEEERKLLLALPPNPYPLDERREVSIGKTPYARFDLNDYSVPHTLVQKTVVVVASTDTVRIFADNQVVATHQRCYDRGRQIENPEHIKKLEDAKTGAGAHRRTNLLADAAPSSTKLLQAVAARGLSLGQATSELLKLLHTFGPTALEDALKEALENGAAHTHAVRHILERTRQNQGKAPALPIPLPQDSRVTNLVIVPHSLQEYDLFLENSNDNETNDD